MNPKLQLLHTIGISHLLFSNIEFHPLPYKYIAPPPRISPLEMKFVSIHLIIPKYTKKNSFDLFLETFVFELFVLMS